MSLTAKQTSRYWREIAEVCRVQGWGNAEKEARRRAIHAAAGCPASMRAFSNSHFDAFLQECAALKNRIDIRDRERERLVWRIQADAKAAGLDPAYLARICDDLHGTGDWESLPEPDLADFRNVIHNRARARGAQSPRNTPAPPVPAPEGLPRNLRRDPRLTP